MSYASEEASMNMAEMSAMPGNSAPSAIGQAMPELEAYLGNEPLLLGQNVRFDIGFLKPHLSLQYLSIVGGGWGSPPPT